MSRYFFTAFVCFVLTSTLVGALVPSAASAHAPSPSTPTTLVAIGDSITQGYGTTDPATESWSALLNDPGRFAVVNTFYSQTPQMAANWTTMTAPYDPDVVLLAGGINDVMHGSIPDAQSSIDWMAQQALSEGVRPFVATLVPTRSAEPRIAAFNQWIRAYVAAHPGVGLIDFYAALEYPIGSGTSPYLSDWCHPTAEGHRIMASVVTSALAVPVFDEVAPGDEGFTSGGAYLLSGGPGVYGSGLYAYCNGNIRDSWVRWSFDLSKLYGTANYKVEAFVPGNATTGNAHYHVNTASGTQGRSVAQNASHDTWADLGTYALSQGAAWVELDDASGETYISASSPKIGFDAIRLTYVSPVTSSVTPPSLRSTALTIAGPPSSLSGSAINVTGLLKLTSGATLPACPVILYSSPDGVSWKAVQSVISASTGALSVSVAPASKTYYLFEFRGDAGFAPCWSASFAVRPMARLVRLTSWSTLDRSKTYYAKGYISPRHATGDTNKVRIRAYKKRSDGKYHYVKSFTANYSYYSSTKTLYRAPVKLTSNGAWKLVAAHAADDSNAKAYGSADYVNVR